MSDFVIHGHPISPFVRSVCLALEEKGQSYSIVPIESFRSPSHRALHPFERIPTIEHGGYRLYETQAILRYIDAKFPAPPLAPTEPEAIGRMNQVIGINDCYLFPAVSRIILFQRVVGPVLRGVKTDEEMVAKTVPDAERSLGELGRILGGQNFFAGDTLSLADLLLAPQLIMLAAAPEGAQILSGTALERWLARMCARPSMKATLPPREFNIPESPGAAIAA